ncbi:hypothetical protein [Bacillus pinisoli]|uniref:hypothetical protein n=1 Tax=Bacillus pinisoli TaxID=2901866 RepID=UPI001FF5FDF2|nr:hypothetical protein [Bacillus pinisoli]
MKETKNTSLIEKIVYYKNCQCKILFDYGNGRFEIMCGEKVLLVSGEEILFSEQPEH